MDQRTCLENVLSLVAQQQQRARLRAVVVANDLADGAKQLRRQVLRLINDEAVDGEAVLGRLVAVQHLHQAGVISACIVIVVFEEAVKAVHFQIGDAHLRLTLP